MRLALGCEHAREFQVDERDPCESSTLSDESVATVPGSDVHPTIHFVFRGLAGAELAFVDGVLTVATSPTQAEEFSIDIASGARLSARQALGTGRLLAEDPQEILFAENPDVAVKGPDDVRLARLVRIFEPLDGPYFVRQDGWWRVTAGQPCAEADALEAYYDEFHAWAALPRNRTMPSRPVDYDLLTVEAGMGADAHIQQNDFINNIVRPGTGSQHILAIRDVGDYACTVRVQNTTAFVFAPRVEFSRAFAYVKVNGEDWAYFDENSVLLPNRTGEYTVDVSAPGARRSVYLARTGACVDRCRWDEQARELVFDTSLGEHVKGLAEGLRHKALIKFDVNRFRLIELENAELVKRVAAAIVVAFTAGETVVCRFGTYDEEETVEETEQTKVEGAEETPKSAAPPDEQEAGSESPAPDTQHEDPSSK